MVEPVTDPDVDPPAMPWLSIIGVGEDGLAGLSARAVSALANAEFLFGGQRHLALVEAGARGRAWPVPFDASAVLAQRGRNVAVLASGDPFWHGVGGSLAQVLHPAEWQVFPAPSTFSLVAARLGWRLEDTVCLGLHAAPFSRTIPHLSAGARLICLMRDGAAASDFAHWLELRGFGESRVSVLEALGGLRERIRSTMANSLTWTDIASPVAVAVALVGTNTLPRTAGLPVDAFRHDGQITKPQIRAMTLAALAPRSGDMLWDLGAGSGSISVEWCLAGGRAAAVERRGSRVAAILANRDSFGLEERMNVLEGEILPALANLPPPDAVFVGGGFDAALFEALRGCVPPGCRLVVNAVTLETEALLMSLHGAHGGELTHIALSQAATLGTMRSWVPARPVVQWAVRL